MLPIEVEPEGDVEVPGVAAIGHAGDGALESLACADGQRLLEVEDRLLPVRVLVPRAGRKGDRLVQLGKWEERERAFRRAALTTSHEARGAEAHDDGYACMVVLNS
jgi:hypothetical protein